MGNVVSHEERRDGDQSQGSRFFFELKHERLLADLKGCRQITQVEDMLSGQRVRKSAAEHWDSEDVSKASSVVCRDSEDVQEVSLCAA